MTEPREHTPGRAERIVYPENPRYQRIRFISKLMDQSITLPNGYRIGLDPLLGLAPGIGDALCTLISLYLIYEAARLGLPKHVLLRMIGNVAVDSLTGSVPLLGDVVDAVWKSNMRNLRLVDRHYHPSLPERPARRLAGWIALVLGIFAAGLFALLFVVAKLVLMVLNSIGL